MNSVTSPILKPVDHRASRDRGNYNRRKGMDRKMAQHDLERKKRACDGGVKAGGNSRRDSATQQVAPRNAVGFDAVADPTGNHSRPYAPQVPSRPVEPPELSVIKDEAKKEAIPDLIFTRPAIGHVLHLRSHPPRIALRTRRR